MATIDYKQKIKDYMNSSEVDTLYKSMLNNLFPELKESNDERIGKEIVNFINHRKAMGTMTPEESKRVGPWIVWLEKQGESDETKAKIFLINNGYPIDSNGKFPTYEEMYYIIKDGIEKQGEQKPADKIEPKFKVGDWVVQENIGVYKVIEICKSWYEVIDSEDNHYSISFDKECMCHLWTIQDAKDGDVLSWDDSKCIAIFKNIYDEDSFNSYGFVGHCTGTFELRQSYHDIDGAHPATKEQCDLLFQKMKEAGYEWDAEKKELKKVEQKQVIDYPDYPDSLPKDNWELIHEFVNKFGRIPKDEDELNALVEYILKRQKSAAWTPMDEQRVENLLAIIEGHGYPGEVAWLNSLEDRIQPKQEWSEEDEKIRSSIIDFIRYELNHHAYIGTAGVNSAQQIEWLQSLHPQSHWKPSDEQIKALANALSLAKSCGEESAFDLRTLYEQLKKLREE